MNDPRAWAGYILLGLAVLLIVVAAVVAWAVGSAITSSVTNLTAGIL